MVYEIVKKIFKSILPKKIKNMFFFRNEEPKYVRFSYSQEGEDLILARIFNEKNSGFYIDVGAYHPKRLSNTYYFYRRGWHGINIDAMPGGMKTFHELRPRDINLEVAISDRNDEQTYYIFEQKPINTFSQILAKEYIDLGYKLIDKLPIKAYSLFSILEQHLPEHTVIDFISIDVEGLEINVLKSNNWLKYSPRFILIEELKFDINHLDECDVYRFLVPLGYTFFAKTYNTIFFKKD